MKSIIFFIAGTLLILSSSCEKQASSASGIVGEWKLIEELMDPGDGSGTFQPVISNKEIKFYANGTFEANGEMCTMTNQASSTHDGTYDVSYETFLPDNCMSVLPMTYQYSLNGNTLILTYPCICGCQHKYSRI